MAKFLLAYHGGGMPETEEEGARVMEAWGAWYQELGSAIADPGNPTGRGATVAPGGAISDGGGANPITGYTILEAADFDTAVTSAKGCPILDSGGSVEVCEIVNVM